MVFRDNRGKFSFPGGTRDRHSKSGTVGTYELCTYGRTLLNLTASTLHCVFVFLCIFLSTWIDHHCFSIKLWQYHSNELLIFAKFKGYISYRCGKSLLAHALLLDKTSLLGNALNQYIIPEIPHSYQVVNPLFTFTTWTTSKLDSQSHSQRLYILHSLLPV